MTPQRIESSLLVVEGFTDSSGFEWQVGDCASLTRSAVRRAARERPELFMVEFETEVFDPGADWFRRVEADYERRYADLKARRDGEEQRRQAVLRAELEQQNRAQPELERRYEQQEKERGKREKKARQEHERRVIETRSSSQADSTTRDRRHLCREPQSSPKRPGG